MTKRLFAALSSGTAVITVAGACLLLSPSAQAATIGGCSYSKAGSSTATSCGTISNGTISGCSYSSAGGSTATSCGISKFY